MPYIQSGDVKLHYRDSGEGYPLLFGHGFFMDSEMFEPQLRAFTPTHRVLAWDAREHGDTEAPDTPFTYWDQAGDVLGLMDALDLPPAVIGGMSQGGFIALRMALLAPERVRALILIDTEAHPCSEPDRDSYSALFAQWGLHGPVADLAVPLAGQLIGEPALEQVWIDRWRARTGRSIQLAARCLLDRDDLREQIAAITCPTLLIRGSKDRAIAPERMQFLANTMPNATEVVTIAGAAHAPNLTHPGPVNDAISSFLHEHGI
ncbi:alpha/beta hydrolase [Rhodococcus erythropolis]|uniref:alpha/beta fold hydrolase n=1 Tax=Rhodococcus erythropolis TaxID=1833 RepID=UPI002949C022|nr:alpha/beta hydrolase [Rhodococcus erythropolis]MDV6278067.1 alpha/beta hydrolase [Rhodococcus erythropolis]